MDDSLAFFLMAGAAAFLVGASKGGLPMVGALGVPLLALVMPPVAAAALLLPVYIVSDVVGLWAYRHEYSRRNLGILIPAMIFGVGVGWATAKITPHSTGMTNGLTIAKHHQVSEAIRAIRIAASTARARRGLCPRATPRRSTRSSRSTCSTSRPT